MPADHQSEPLSPTSGIMAFVQAAAAAASFRAMDAEDRETFGDADQGSTICMLSDDVVILQAPDGRLSFIGHHWEEGPWQIDLSLETVL